MNIDDNVRSLWRYDLQDLLRGKRTFVAILIFVVIIEIQVLFGYLILKPQDELTTTRLVAIVSDGLRFIVPIFGILVGYGAIAGDRETNRLRLYLSTPYIPREFFIGRFLSRLSWSVFPVSIGLTTGVLTCIVFSGYDFVPIISLIGSTLLLVSLSVSVSVAVSAITRSSRSALFISLGILAFFYTSWWMISVTSLFFTSSITTTVIINLADPTTAYSQIFSTLTGDGGTFTLVAAVLSLVAWLVIPFTVGLRTFEKSDI